ncbi:protein SIEVE ELEMENT OCCLUSION B-like [Morus notabilis]|uniref:protein SIEVE ELEMENT OCCLUSION B-like n=1 Tax=Morus notabilis TaxID=981085 RepID=UPI000CED41F7|nr:protein SIEVE ELEMENT OCCLUSION B-like [Morus notabilis]
METTIPTGTASSSAVSTTPLGAAASLAAPLSINAPVVLTTRPTTPLVATGTTAASGVQPKVEQNLAARFLANGRSSRSPTVGASSHRSDDTELSKRILETHESDDRGLPVKPVLRIIDVIFYRANVDLPGYVIETDNTADEKVLYSSGSLQDFVEIPSRITSAISCEIFSKCSTGVDVHTIVMDILRLIKHYSWESKAVLALTSFAVTFGEFRIVLQLYSTSPLAKSVALLKQLPEVLEHAADLRPKLNELYSLINEITDVTKKIVEFYDIPRVYFTAESPEILAAIQHIPTAVYWSIRSIVVAATQILALTGMGIDYLTETWELSSLSHKLNNIKGHLADIIKRCYEFIERKKEEEAYEMIVRTFTTSHIDNSRPLRVLFKDDPTPAIYDCFNRRKVTIEELRRKVVALFITAIDPELSGTAEYAILQQMYSEKKHNLTRSESQYEVVWVPVADIWTDEKYRLFETLRDQMEWHSVHHPSVVSAVVRRFFREKWNFSKKPLLVVMDTQGRIVHHNAIHMMCIWGSLSYPFTANREKLLWEETNWTIDLLADNLEPNMISWINEGRYICLYGGEDMEWIRKFTRIAKDVARESGITLELLYVGKNKGKERITKNIIDLITNENLSRSLDWNLIWYFWLRLESMWNSKGQFANPENVKNDLIMQGIIAMLSYGSSDQGFAVISRGFGQMAKGNGEHMFKGLAEHGRWRKRETEISFVPALDEYLRKIHLDAPHHCTSLILPGTGAMPDTVACAECGRLMEKYTMFRCCLD